MESIVIEKNNTIINIYLTKNTQNNNINISIINYNSFKENNNLLINYINRITNKNNLYTLVISNKKLLDSIISIIHDLKYITIIIIDIKILLDNKYVYKLLECNNIKVIKCYEINSLLFCAIDSSDKIFITTNLNYNTIFYKNNNIMTSSLIYYKREIIVDKDCNEDDIQYFISINNYLDTINIYYINNRLIKHVIDCLIKYNRHDIKIILKINESNANILNKNIKYLRKLEKIKCEKYNIDIEAVYSKEYRDKFFLKELNNAYLKTSIIIIFIIVLTSFGIIGYYEHKTNKAIEDVQNISGILDMLDNDEEIIDRLEDNDDSISDNNVNDNKNNNSGSNNNTTTNNNGLSQDFDKLLSINSEFVGWLKVNNTKVNYPVVRHSDNDYYLKHNFYNSVNNAGWVFMDYRNEIDNMDQNTIIYGHSNTINETMFGSLYKVLNKNWYTNKNNQIITFNSLNAKMRFQIFAIYITDPEYYYIWTNFHNNIDRFNTFISEVKQKSIYNFGIDVTMDDKILTLSTCYNHGTQRIAIHAKKI